MFFLSTSDTVRDRNLKPWAWVPRGSEPNMDLKTISCLDIRHRSEPYTGILESELMVLASLGVAGDTISLTLAADLARKEMAMHWTQVYDPLGHWWLSTLVAALPIIILFVLLAGLRVKPHWCA